jgi:formyltetrahydrofolate deformylase
VSKDTAVLLISCPDQKGLVAGVANFVYRHDGNMIHAEQHIDAPQHVFFHRVEWELDGFGLGKHEIAEAFSEVAEPFQMRWRLHFSCERPRMAIFVSKYDHCLLELLYRHKVGELPGEIVAVVSNHPDLEPLVTQFEIPFHLFPVEAKNKREQEAQELALLQKLNVELVVLARYMQVLSPDFVSEYPSRIINIHHSFLPAFIGGSPYHQAFERGVKLIGATSHYVTDQLDDGPIIEQDVCRITHRDSLGELMLKGRDLEREVLARSVRMHLLHRVLPYGRKTVVFDGG